MGTPLREVIEVISGGPLARQRASSRSSPACRTPIITADQLDTPVSYEGLAAIGSGLGSAGFIVLDDHDDPVAFVAGVSRFLAVESCGQCTPCKLGGVALSGLLERLCRNDVGARELAAIDERVATVADGARCYLANQQQVVVGSLIERFPGLVAAHADGTATPVEPSVVAELLDVSAGTAVVDLHHREKQPDWTFDEVDSGQVPADRLGEHRVHQPGGPAQGR